MVCSIKGVILAIWKTYDVKIFHHPHFSLCSLYFIFIFIIYFIIFIFKMLWQRFVLLLLFALCSLFLKWMMRWVFVFGPSISKKKKILKTFLYECNCIVVGRERGLFLYIIEFRRFFLSLFLIWNGTIKKHECNYIYSLSLSISFVFTTSSSFNYSYSFTFTLLQNEKQTRLD